MAQRIQALNALRPRIEQGSTVQREELLRAIARVSLIPARMIEPMIVILRDLIIDFCCTGRAVKVDGLGTFAPSIDLEGNFSIVFRADAAFAKKLNVPDVFTGTIVNRRNIGKSSAELVEMR